MTFDLVIFDCDGVLVNSEPIANRVDTEQLGSIGLNLSSEEIMRRFVGRTKEGCIALAGARGVRAALLEPHPADGSRASPARMM